MLSKNWHAQPICTQQGEFHYQQFKVQESDCQIQSLNDELAALNQPTQTDKKRGEINTKACLASNYLAQFMNKNSEKQECKTMAATFKLQTTQIA